MTVVVDAEGVARYTQEIEAAVYFCCLEALQNAQKYAEASAVSIRLRADAGVLRFVVEDDGHGFDVVSMKKGAGLTNMADRLDALGGSVEITSVLGKGTSLRGQLPYRSTVAPDDTRSALNP